MKDNFFYLQIALAIVIILFFLFGCSKPVLKHEAYNYSQGTKEATESFRNESRGFTENLTVDSVIVVRIDTVTKDKILVKYYGVAKTKTDTLRVLESKLEMRIDTVYKDSVVHLKEENNLPFGMGTAKFILLATALGLAIVWIIRRN